MDGVPKIIHQFWDRPTPPDDVAARIASWRHHHPGWRHILWNDETAENYIGAEFGHMAVRCFVACVPPAMRADVLRLAAMVKLGGVYVDADAWCTGPVDEFAAQPTLYVGSGSQSGDVKIKNSFFADVPGKRLFRWAWKMALRNIELEKYPGHVSRTTGPMMLTRVWNERLSEEQRREYRLATGPELGPAFVHHGGDLEYRKEGGHWPVQAGKAPIIEWTRAERLGLPTV